MVVIQKLIIINT
ncbi:hypothetical protein FWK35_00029419 [Aphis craccivora]|nr:hypothetical protein FWK35_00025673 [Aphis craccivora]KAF0767239.1 hypothetical protein FWK35_00029419 [Aphis craccivora]